METMARLHILIHKKTKEVLISRFKKKKIGTLEGWFACGRFYKYSYDNMLLAAWTNINIILSDSCDENDKCDYDRMKDSQLKYYKVISLMVYEDEITMSPFGNTSKHGSATTKFSTKIEMPVDDVAFADQLRRAIEAAE